MNDQAATLRLAVLPRGGLLADAVLVFGGACLIAASAQVSIPLRPVPITGQTFSVLLVGAALGSACGGAASLLYVLAGLVLPVYASHASGFSVISGASGGYLVSFPFVSALTGWLAERRWDRRFSSAVGAMLTGNLLIYLVGLPWLHFVLHTNLDQTLEYGLYKFVPGDMIKLYLAAALLPGAWKLVARMRS